MLDLQKGKSWRAASHEWLYRSSLRLSHKSGVDGSLSERDSSQNGVLASKKKEFLFKNMT